MEIGDGASSPPRWSDEVAEALDDKTHTSESSSVTSDDVLREVQELSENLSSYFKTLRKILLRHEGSIRKRWTAKTSLQRQGILLNAWPSLTTTHGLHPGRCCSVTGLPDPFIDENCTGNNDVWLRVNREYILEPNSLLSLLNARGHSSPAVFAHIDGDALSAGSWTGTLLPVSVPHYRYIMILHDAGNLHEYGRIISFDKDPELFELAVFNGHYDVGEGILILEAQERLLHFLISCCQQIMHDIPIESLAGAVVPIQTSPSLLENGPDPSKSLFAVTTEASYSVPREADFGFIERLLRGHLSGAEDSVWMLREDPSYFLEQLRETEEHRLEAIGDYHGKSYREDPAYHERFMARVCAALICDSYAEFVVFAELHRQAYTLKQLYEKHKTATPLKRGGLQRELNSATVRLQFYLHRIAAAVVAMLMCTVPMSAPWRIYFSLQPTANPFAMDLNGIYVVPHSKIGMGELERQGYSLFRSLGNVGLYPSVSQLRFDELTKFLRTAPRARYLVSTRVLRLLGEVAICMRCLQQLGNFSPWPLTPPGAMITAAPGLTKEFNRWQEHFATVFTVISENNTMGLTDFRIKPFMKYAYPAEERRTKRTVERMRHAEYTLDSLWAGVDRLLARECGSLVHPYYRRLLSQQMRRTPDWAEAAGMTAVALDPESTYLDKPLSTVYYVDRLPEDNYLDISTSEWEAESESTPDGEHTTPCFTYTPSLRQEKLRLSESSKTSNNSGFSPALPPSSFIKRCVKGSPQSSTTESWDTVLESLDGVSGSPDGEPILDLDSTTKTNSVTSFSTDSSSYIPITAKKVNLAAPSSISVDRRSLHVFHTLFYDPEKISSLPLNEVAWSDFLHAMTATGLFAAQEIYISIWHFKRLLDGNGGEGEGRCIAFYAPLPRYKIPRRTAMHYGRRLNKAFGWSRDTFVLEGTT